ncbi:IS1595 family transposase [Fusibacter tunisiensis]|uniref:Transposase-like protein n=1 Tax=Fusibacter tunisiensis TaxID=1008308 RepID=A0ABS2MP36_9FIRM|nr:IS1595 family transposase [Fusibacter tunisiensis]MBM7561153.1 transposase-like protein [Fusibacter tunisiensis]
MPSIHSIFRDIKALTDSQIEELFNTIGEIISLRTMTGSLYNDSREQRFSKGVACLHCGSMNVIKHGKKNDVQRFRCKDCERTFNDRTMTPLANSHVSLEQWIDYAKCMVMGLSIRKSAKICEVSVKTSFYMRHRLLDAVRNFQGVGEVSGIVEMDETFLPESFKGNHKKSGFIMPRKSRKRGKQIKKRGISNEQVCMATAIDREGNIIFEMTNKGRIKTADLERLYKGRLDPNALICTDSHKSYITFAKGNVAEHIRIASGKHKNGVYHISHVNSLHSKFKKWIDRFNGVATKYLPNYLHWFKWLQTFIDEKEIAKARQLLVNSNTFKTDICINQYRMRGIVFS